MFNIFPTDHRFFVTAVLFSFTISSAETVLLSGRITDRVGEPIPFVEVYSATTHAGTTTNREGQFILALEDQSVDKLVVSHSAFTVQEVSLDTVSASDIQIRLSRRIYRFDPVIVEGKSLRTAESRTSCEPSCRQH